MNFKHLLILCLSGFLLSACSKEDPDMLIQQYLEDNNLTAEKTSEGLYYIIETPGTGRRPSINNSVRAHYQGELLNGNIFDSSYSRGAPSDFSLGGVIRGWQIGIPLFREGGKGKLIIPPDLGYGSRGQGSIPGNAVLVFDVELIRVL